jgi:glycosyltransferase involved in cell wall biosynthesis
MLGFLFQHYDDFVERYVIFDDGSTDGSLEILRSHPKVDVRPMPPRSDPESRILSSHPFFEDCWKESRGHADWVIVTDIDEHIWHSDLARYLTDCRHSGVTIIPGLGYHMLSETFPEPGCCLRQSVVTGAPDTWSSKMNLFSPDAIEATNFELGRHSAAPVGRVLAPARDELLVLHYRFLGFERTQRRHEEYLKRQRPKDLANDWGFQYSWSRQQLRERWDALQAQAVDVSDPALRPWATHKEPRWWMGYPRAG